MATVTLDFPDQVVSANGRSPEEFARAFRLAAATYWYTRGEISMGRAAEIAGLNLADFLDSLASRKIDVFLVDMDDLNKELSRG
jgi:predicted HTH domain antitoxin